VYYDKLYPKQTHSFKFYVNYLLYVSVLITPFYLFHLPEKQKNIYFTKYNLTLSQQQQQHLYMYQSSLFFYSNNCLFLLTILFNISLDFLILILNIIIIIIFFSSFNLLIVILNRRKNQIFNAHISFFTTNWSKI